MKIVVDSHSAPLDFPPYVSALVGAGRRIFVSVPHILSVVWSSPGAARTSAVGRKVDGCDFGP